MPLVAIGGSTWADVRGIPPLSTGGLLLEKAKGSAAARPAARRRTAKGEPIARETGRHLVIQNGLVRVRADRHRGVFSVTDLAAGRELSDSRSSVPFGAYRYDVFSRREIVAYLKSYAYDLQQWFIDDFGKPGYPERDHETFEGTLAHVAADGADGWARLRLSWKQDPRSVRELGNAPVVLQEVTIYRDRPWVDLAWTLEGKEACPLLEAGHVVLPFALERPRFAINKTGCVVDPSRDIARDANHGLHCCDRWLDLSDARGGVLMIPFDSPLVSFGAPAVEKFDGVTATRSSTVFFNLFNTQWGTNFPQWIGGTLRFRCRLIPHPGDWRKARAWEQAASALQPPHFHASKAGPSRAGLLVAPASNLQTVTLKPAESGGGIILRVRETSGRAGKRVLRLRARESGKDLRVVHCSLLEEEQETLSLSVSKGSAALSLWLRPFEVVTLKLA